MKNYFIENQEKPYLIRIQEREAEKIIPVQIRVEPETLNLAQRGVFTVFLQIDNGFGVSIEEIDLVSIALEGVEPTSTTFNKGKNELILKFNTQGVTNILPENEVELKLTGNLLDGTKIEGIDIVRVISKGKLYLSLLDIWNKLSALIYKLIAALTGASD